MSEVKYIGELIQDSDGVVWRVSSYSDDYEYPYTCVKVFSHDLWHTDAATVAKCYERMHTEPVTPPTPAGTAAGGVKTDREIARARILERDKLEQDVVDLDGDNLNLRVKIEQLTAERDALTSELATVRAALQPFADQWAGWQRFANLGGEMNIVEFFTDCLDDAIFAKWLRNAALAASGRTGEGS